MPENLNDTHDSEGVYYEDKNGNRVTSISLTTKTNAFYIKDISSVFHVKNRWQNTSTGFFLMFIGFMLMLISGSTGGGSLSYIGLAVLLLGALLVGLAKPGYILKVRIGMKAITALKTNSVKNVENIMLAINQAKADNH